MSNAPLTLRSFLPHGMNPDTFVIGVAGVVALLCVLAVSKNFHKRDHWSSRIKNIQERRRELVNEVNGPRKRKKPEGSVNFMRAVAMKFQLVKKLQLEKAEMTLIHAGYRTKDAILIFAFANMVVPIGLGVLGFLYMKLQTPHTFAAQVGNYAWPILGAYIGLKLPWMVLGRLRKKRFLAIQRALSDTLDLMTVCAEAGLSLSAMLDRVARELGIVYPEMAEELTLTSIELGFLPDRNKALMNLAERCEIKEVRGIVTVLIQTEKYGTPIAQALRVLSTEFRTQRMMRAEGKAARLPALMTVPMILFILPTLFIIIMTPAVITTLNNFAQNDAQTSGGKK